MSHWGRGLIGWEIAMALRPTWGSTNPRKDYGPWFMWWKMGWRGDLYDGRLAWAELIQESSMGLGLGNENWVESLR